MNNSEEWLATKDAMNHIGVKRSESLPVWIDRPGTARRLVFPTGKYKPVRVEKRGTTRFYNKSDLDAWLAFQQKETEKQEVLRLHKATRVCAECKEPWPCPDYRKAQR
jgi:hypothetical protein